METKNHRFPKEQKLKSRKTLEQIFASGKKLYAGNIRIRYLIGEGETGVKCGVGLSGRFFKKAVDRNRIKRLLREAYRLQKQDLVNRAETSGKQVSLFILYAGRELPDYTIIYENLGVALQKLLNALDTTSRQDP